jgi:hypothetical protein
VARPCFVCGLDSDAEVCPRCNTVLRPDRAACDTCGRPFVGWLATCEACRASIAREGRYDPDALRALASFPGVTEERAKDLVAQGFRDVSDLVRLALPKGAVRLGLHHTIARKALLVSLGPRAEPEVSGARCPMCGAGSHQGADRYASCGSIIGALGPPSLEQKLREITGEVDDLTKDADFQGMPADIRNEFLQASTGVGQDAHLREEWQHQIDAWRPKGFDATPVEALLVEDVDEFRERSTRLIRAEILKDVTSGTHRCPLCEMRLDSAAAECGNCGARFC